MGFGEHASSLNKSRNNRQKKKPYRWEYYLTGIPLKNIDDNKKTTAGEISRIKESINTQHRKNKINAITALAISLVLLIILLTLIINF